MTTRLLNIIIILALTSCSTKPDGTKQSVTYEDSISFPDNSPSLDSATFVLDTFLVVLERLYSVSDKNTSKALKQADSLLFNCDTNYRRTKHTINNNMMQDLHFFKGEILFKEGKHSAALKEFTYDTIVDYNLGRAACLLKLKREPEAFQNIQEHRGFCYDDFVLGNYYEIVGKTDTALLVYKRAINSDMTKGTPMYNAISTRINELSMKKNSQHLRLYIPTRRPSHSDSYDCR